MQQLSSLLDASNSLKSQNSVLTRMLKLGQQRRSDEQQHSSEQPTQGSAQQSPHASAALSPSLALSGPAGASTAASGVPWQGDKQAEGLTLTVKGGQPIQLTADQVGHSPHSMPKLIKLD